MKMKKIVKITKSKSEVYDINVKRNHTFIYDGTVLHNCDFQGQIICSMLNRTNDSFYTIEPGERIAQAMIVPKIQFNEDTITVVEEFTKHTSRDSAGFGTTGKF